MNRSLCITVSATVLCASGAVSSTRAGTQRLELDFQPVGGVVSGGSFPVPVSQADLQNITGTIQLFQNANNPTFFAVDVNQGGLQSVGFTVDILDAVININSGVITSAFFDVTMSDGSFFQAQGGSGGQSLNIGFSNNAYHISGGITNLQLNGPTLAGVDVSGPFAAQPLFGSFFDFSFAPLNGVDFETQLIFEVASIAVPLPTAMGLGGAGLLAILGRRRRTSLPGSR